MEKKTLKILAVLAVAVMAVSAVAFMQMGQAEEEGGFVVTLWYADGSSQSFKRSDGVLTQLKLFNGAQEITAITVNLYQRVTYSGATMTSYSISGNAQGQLWKGTTQVATLWSQPMSVSGGAAASGQTVQASTSTITASTIESLYSGWIPNNDYIYVVHSPSPVQVNLSFSDGTTSSQNVQPVSVKIGFTYKTATTVSDVSIWWG